MCQPGFHILLPRNSVICVIRGLGKVTFVGFVGHISDMHITMVRNFRPRQLETIVIPLIQSKQSRQIQQCSWKTPMLPAPSKI